MPRGNGTGPSGMGPMTGRAAGFCAGYGTAGYLNSAGGGGYWGRGRSFGRGRGFGRGWFGCGPAVGPAYPYGGVPVDPDKSTPQELEALKGQAQYLENSLSQIKERITELEKQNK